VADRAESLDPAGDRGGAPRTVVVIDHRQKGVPLPLPVALPLYVGALLVAECLVALVDPLAGALVDAVALFVLANHLVALVPDAAGGSDAMTRPGEVLEALALVAWMRLASLSLPLTNVPEAYWSIAVGLPVAAAAAMVTRVGVPEAELRSALADLRRREWTNVEALWPAVAVGTGVSLAGYVLLDPPALASTASWPRLLAASVGVVLFAGVLEEVIFRGLLQSALRRVLGRPGVVLACVLYGAAYLGTDSVAAVVYFTLLGIAFAIHVERTDSLVDVAAAHGAVNLGLLVVWPLILG
jgi:uncharacterized protein